MEEKEIGERIHWKEDWVGIFIFLLGGLFIWFSFTKTAFLIFIVGILFLMLGINIISENKVRRLSAVVSRLQDSIRKLRGK